MHPPVGLADAPLDVTPSAKVLIIINALECREPSPALMQMSTCAYLITHVALEGRVTLAKMAENNLKF